MDCLAGFWDHGVVSMFPSDVSVCTTGTPGMFDKFNQKLNLIGGQRWRCLGCVLTP
jgi:hypothetical protein